MLIHPWDAAISDAEWRDWLAGHDFGQLAVNDPHNGAPHVIPTHFALDGDTHSVAGLLRRQLAHFQPQGDHARVGVDLPPYGRMLSGIRGLRLHITSVAAKFKYDDHNPLEHRAQVAERLESRGSGRDRSAAAQQRRRLKEIGEWKPRH